MEEKNKQSFSLLGVSIWKLCTYFIIYSFLGYIIETLFGIATKGLWECRQSFLYGPFLRNIRNRGSYYINICKIF